MSIHVCMIFVEGGVGEENVLEWGGEEIVFFTLFYFGNSISLYIYFYWDEQKVAKLHFTKNVNMISFLL